MKNYLERNFWLGTRAERVTVTPFENAYWIEQDTGELWGFWFGVWHCLSGVGGAGGVLEGPGIDLVGSQVGLGGDTVLLYDDGGNPVAEFATVTLALASAVWGNMVLLPPGRFVEDFTVPEGVTLASMGNDSIVIGTITLGGAWANLKGITIDLIGNSAGTLVGLIGPPSGEAIANDCSIKVTNNGSGDSNSIQMDDGDLLIFNCVVEATSVGGNGYGIAPSDGIAHMVGGILYGSTQPMSGEDWGLGALISNDNTPATDDDGTELDIVIGQYYAIRRTGGSFYHNVPPLKGPYYGYELSNDDGVNWYEPQECPWLGFYDPSGGQTSYWEATTVHVRIRCSRKNAWPGGTWTGSLDTAFYNAVFVTGTVQLQSVNLDPGHGGIPDWSDRSAWDVAGYPERHARDIEDGSYQYHNNPLAPLKDHDHSGDAGDGGQFELTNLLSSGASNGQMPIADGSGGINWGGGGGGIPPTTLSIASDSLDTPVGRANAIGWKIGAIQSITLSGITYQVYAFYDEDGFVSIATRTIPGTWTIYQTVLTGMAGDGHDYVSLGLDPDGYIHICWDMHVQALKYRRSVNPIDTFDGTLTGALAMLGTHETKVTYPTFFNDPSGILYFIFRDCENADHGADFYFYVYDEATTTWSGATGTGAAGIWFNGIGLDDIPYIYQPVFDDDFGTGGVLHLFWALNDDALTTYSDMGYAAWDGTDFHQSDGGAQAIPITRANQDNILDLGDTTTQPTCVNNAVYSDSSGYPHIIYSRMNIVDSENHFYHLWFDGANWIELEIGTTSSAAVQQWGVLAIDRDTDTAYVVYIDTTLGDDLYMLKSAAGDFTVWINSVVYTDTITGWQPKYDLKEWERSKTFSMPVELWGVHPLPIILLEFSPISLVAGWAVYDALGNPTKHTNDLNIGMHWTKAYLDGLYAAIGHTHALGGLSNVNVPAPSDEDILTYDTGTGKWIASPPPAPSGQYRQFTYIVEAGDFSFVIDADGNPIMALQDLE